MSYLSRRKFLAASGLAGLSALGCIAASESATNPKKDAPPVPPPSGDVAALAAANTAFAVELYSKLRAEPGNLFLSPFSISTALAMTAAGAKGTTLDEMNKVLHLPADAAPTFRGLLARVNGDAASTRGYQLSTANALWGMTGFPWRKEFTDLTRENFGAGLIDTDFTKPEEARARINAWVEKETKEKIKDLIPAGILSALTRMVLTNAIYFKGSWLSEFKKELTTTQPFLLADGTKADVPLMNQQKTFPYHEEEGLQVVELPYAKNELAMVLVLPTKPDGLAKVEETLTAAKVAAWAKGVKPETTRVFLPRFKAEKAFDLIPPLKALGMTAVFGADADLSGMHTGQEKLAVSDVLHKAFVDVNEEGTEAAGATAVVVARASAPPPIQPKVFRADRPFLFLIRENATGSVLFLGRYAGPK